jgi:hypothetical protein
MVKHLYSSISCSCINNLNELPEAVKLFYLILEVIELGYSVFYSRV